MIIFALSYIPSPLIDMNNYYRISSLLPFAFQSVCYALDVAMHPKPGNGKIQLNRVWSESDSQSSSYIRRFRRRLVKNQVNRSPHVACIFEPTMLLKSRYEKLKFLSSLSHPGWRLMRLFLCRRCLTNYSPIYS